MCVDFFGLTTNSTLQNLNHINILKCHNVYVTVNNFYIITQFCNEGDLENLLKKRQKLPEEEVIPIFQDIVNGFKFIAEAGFLHGDLKPENILIKDKIAKIADFGFVKRASSNSRQIINTGSPPYMSPQALKSNIYTIKNDIWSLGIILYQMLHGRVPWQFTTEQQLIEKIDKQIYILNRNLSEDLKDFIRKCLISDQSKRMSFIQFQNHPFILRITQYDELPQLLQNQTSCNGNDPAPKDFNTHKEISTNNHFENITIEPTSIHYRKNLQSKSKAQKQFVAQLNYMQYIYRFLQQFPTSEDSGVYTLGLRFLATKQMLCLFESLKKSIQNGDNAFNFYFWNEFMEDEQKLKHYKYNLDKYKNRYEKNKKKLEELINLVKKDRRLTSICDTNFARSQLLSIFSIKYAIQECKQIWADLCKKKSKQKSKQKNKQSDEAQFSRVALHLDLIMTFYQLNCLLIDNFQDPDYFARNSKIDTIIQYKPAVLLPPMKPQLEYKLKSLQIIK